MGAGGVNIRNLTANAAVYKDAVHSVAGAGSVSGCNDAGVVATGVAGRLQCHAAVTVRFTISSKCVTPMVMCIYKTRIQNRSMI